MSYLRGPIRVAVREPDLETFVAHRDIKPSNVLLGVGFDVAPGTPVGDVIEAGFPAGVIVDFGTASEISIRDLAAILGTSDRTISRKVVHDERLGAAESDRAYRLFEMVATAVHASGDVERGLRWMKRAVPSLGGRRPIDLLRTEIGTRQVLSALDRIQYGGVA
ncbi:MAG TPA: antitoxin Xre/MbcA/ParS toxin-binding domain-containing protein [Candidatus Elarobacter sp.]